MGIGDFVFGYIDYNNSRKQRVLTESEIMSRSKITRATKYVDTEIRNDIEDDQRKKRIREICIALGEYAY